MYEVKCINVHIKWNKHKLKTALYQIRAVFLPPNEFKTFQLWLTNEVCMINFRLSEMFRFENAYVVYIRGLYVMLGGVSVLENTRLRQ